MKNNVFRELRVRSGLALSCLAIVTVALAGCGGSDVPQFSANMVAIADAQVPAAQQQELANVLEAMYGTPDDPFVLGDANRESHLDLKLIRVAAGPVRSDQFGRETGLYRRHCGHCHGTTGDGQGPTAMLLNPYPRDYRQGKFKFKSTERAAKPTEYDLERIVREGVPGTAMPSFELLPDTQIKALVEYVKYLSMRGQTEIDLINAISALGEDEQLDTSRAVLVDEILVPLAESWTTASEKIVQPDRPTDEEKTASIAKGRELFYGTAANCVKCHGPSALGDGQTNDYDDWTKPLVEMAQRLKDQQKSLDENPDMPASERSQQEAQIEFAHEVLANDALPPRNAIPRNLRQNVYRGGRRPVDIYRRISAGINGVPMPGVGPATPGAQGTLKPEEVWNLVDYVLSLPYEPASRPPRQEQLRFSQTQQY